MFYNDSLSSAEILAPAVMCALIRRLRTVQEVCVGGGGGVLAGGGPASELLPSQQARKRPPPPHLLLTNTAM